MREEQERKEQERSVTWSQYYGDNRDWLASQIDALEDMDQIKGERRPTLDLTWVLGLYRLARDYLDAFDVSHTMLHEMKTSMAPLERIAATLESGASASEVKLPKIPIDWDTLASISKLPPNAESLDHLAHSTAKPGKEETEDNVLTPKRMSRSL
jgi:hypothetical protein